MGRRGACALAAGTWLLCRLAQRSPLFAAGPGGPGPARALRGSSAQSAATGGPLEPSAAGSSVPAWAAVAAVAALGLAARPASRGPHSAAVVARFGKKRGGGGRGGGGGGGGDDASEQAVEIDTEAIIKEYEGKMDSTITLLRENLAGIRAGRATPALLDGISVTAYESQVGIKEVGTITVTDTTTLTVAVFDEDVAPAVEKAILTADLGYSAQVNGQSIKVGIPPLTKEKRAQYAKMAKEFTEKSRVAVRNVRQAALKKVKGLNKKVSEDVVKSLQNEVESLVKKNIGECDKIFKAKETEIMNG